MSKVITHGSTFSGIGAPEVAAAMLGWQNVFHCEINPFGRKVLDYYFPKAKSYEDITKTDFSQWGGQITVLTGGFPCQPFSYAGKRRGSEDDRYLWPFMLRCIEQVRPTWFVGENVAGITTMEFPAVPVQVGEETDLFGDSQAIYELRQQLVLHEIIQSLERIGYSVQPLVIPACAVGAPHRRDRVFIIAHILAEDTMHSGQLGREHDEQGSERNIGNTCARGAERICGEQMAGTSSHTVSTRTGCDNGETCDEIWRTVPGGSKSLRQAHGEIGASGTDSTSGNACKGRSSSYTPSQRRREIYEQVQSQLANGAEPFGNGRERTAADTCSERQSTSRLQDRCERQTMDGECESEPFIGIGRHCSELLPDNRWRTFPSVSPVYRGNDGLPFPVDDLTIPFSEWKRESLKAYGNAIVPQVMYEIFRGIDQIERGIAE